MVIDGSPLSYRTVAGLARAVGEGFQNSTWSDGLKIRASTAGNALVNAVEALRQLETPETSTPLFRDTLTFLDAWVKPNGGNRNTRSLASNLHAAANMAELLADTMPAAQRSTDSRITPGHSPTPAS